MPGIIRSGWGGRWLAKVNENGRLWVNALSINSPLAANQKGDAYNLNTGEITLTDAADTPVLYVKNNETEDLNITAIAVGFQTSTAGTATVMNKVTIIRNPTTGTIITSTPTDISINSNRNYGSTKTLTVDAYKGATGDTMTNGDDHILIYQSDFGRLFASIDEVLPQGSSIGIKITPMTSNTSLTVYCALICHLSDPKEA